jgi:hypothetical protein
VLESECGVVIDPASRDAAGKIVATVRGWSADREASKKVGERGREAFLSAYEREACCAQWGRVIDTAWPHARRR